MFLYSSLISLLGGMMNIIIMASFNDLVEDSWGKGHVKILSWQYIYTRRINKFSRQHSALNILT